MLLLPPHRVSPRHLAIVAIAASPSSSENERTVHRSILPSSAPPQPAPLLHAWIVTPSELESRCSSPPSPTKIYRLPTPPIRTMPVSSTSPELPRHLQGRNADSVRKRSGRETKRRMEEVATGPEGEVEPGEKKIHGARRPETCGIEVEPWKIYDFFYFGFF
jgi:hypothetical protein